MPKRLASLYEQLRDLIIRGRIAPGSRIVEQEIAERLDVSRLPARKAMRQLEQEGFLVGIGAGRRAQLIVAPLTAADLVDLYDLMAVLEGAAARHVARLPAERRREVGRDLVELDAAFQKLGRERVPDYDRLFEAHHAVHTRFVDASAAPRLRGIIAKIRPQVDRYEYVYAPLVGPNYEETFQEHEAMVLELHSGTETAAETAVRNNWINGGQRLLKAIEKAGPRGDW